MSVTFGIPGVPEAIGKLVDSLPDELGDSVSLYPFWQGKPNEMLLHVRDVGAFRVTNGTTIEVAPSPLVQQSTLDVYLHGAVRAALIQQRGELALQAATLTPPNGECAVALCGAAVVGKSTLAAELCRRGWRLLADDLTRVQCFGASQLACPSDTAVKLWKDACDTLGIPVESLKQVRPDTERFIVPVGEQTEALPLKLVVQLRPKAAGLTRTPSSIEKMVVLNQHVFRRKQIAALGMSARHSSNIMQLAVAVELGTLHGSRVSSVMSNADKIEEALAWLHR